VLWHGIEEVGLRVSDMTYLRGKGIEFTCLELTREHQGRRHRGFNGEDRMSHRHEP